MSTVVGPRVIAWLPSALSDDANADEFVTLCIVLLRLRGILLLLLPLWRPAFGTPVFILCTSYCGGVL